MVVEDCSEKAVFFYYQINLKKKIHFTSHIKDHNLHVKERVDEKRGT